MRIFTVFASAFGSGRPLSGLRFCLWTWAGAPSAVLSTPLGFGLRELSTPFRGLRAPIFSGAVFVKSAVRFRPEMRRSQMLSAAFHPDFLSGSSRRADIERSDRLLLLPIFYNMLSAGFSACRTYPPWCVCSFCGRRWVGARVTECARSKPRKARVLFESVL